MANPRRFCFRLMRHHRACPGGTMIDNYHRAHPKHSPPPPRAERGGEELGDGGDFCFSFQS